MLRLLSRCVAVVLFGGLFVNASGAERQPDAAETGRAARTAERAVRDAESLQGQDSFSQQLQKQRDAVSQATPTTNPRIDLGSQAPTPTDWIDAARGSSSPAGSSPKDRPLLVLVSFSMPDTELRELARQAARIGAPLILRGLVDASLPATQRKLASYADVTGASFVVDPTLFRRFGVSAVPSFVLPLEALHTCSESDCPAPAHVKLSGDAGIDHVLDQIGRRAKDERARTLAMALRTRLVAAP